MKKIILVLAFVMAYSGLSAQSAVSIFAGGGSSLGDGVPATTARLSGAEGLCADGAGNIYIMETGYQRVRKVTPAGIISTVAGSGSGGYSGDGGPATAALINAYGVGCDLAGNLFIGDWDNNRVRRVDAATGVITTVAGNGGPGSSGDGGPATAAQVSRPIDAHVDLAGNIYISEYGAARIRRVDAVTGIITTVGGNGSGGHSGDGGPATAAQIDAPCQLTIDAANNIYIAEQGGWLRKISASGIISTVAGGGSSTASGIPATAALLSGPEGVSVDCNGNVFIGDNDNELVRMVDASGIITTIAGGGSTAPTVSGIPATSSSFHNEMITLDYAGNLYASNGGPNTYKITHVSTPSSGFVSLPGRNVCIGGTTTYGVTGGVWTSASTSVATIDPVSGMVTGITVGTANISCTTTGCATQVSTTTVDPLCSGAPVPGTAGAVRATGCGNPDTLKLTGYANSCGTVLQWQSSADDITWTNITGATSTAYPYHIPYLSLYYRCAVTCTGSGITAYSNAVYIPAVSGVGLHTAANPPDTVCNGADFYVSVCGAPTTSFNVTTWYGDGSSDNNLLTTTGTRHADILHHYAFPGNYSVKQVLFDGITPVDSTSFPYQYLYCSILPVRFYYDANNNCIFDGGDVSLSVPVSVEIDSNGIPVGTVSATGGFYYESKGGPGTIYGFKIKDTSWLTCPSSIYDTITPYVNSYPVKYVALTPSPFAHFDLAINPVVPVTGVNDQWGHIYVQNNMGLPATSIVTLTYDPRWYLTTESDPMPTVSGTTATWTLSSVSPGAKAPVDIYYVLRDRPTPLAVGVAVQGKFTASPISGDMDPANNIVIRQDTTRAGCDPNYIENVPAACIPVTAGTSKIEYAIHFENTGNDTAFNIHVMDTLSPNIDPHTLTLSMASANMNIGIFNDGINNIVKFDFPNINLLDSSHHGACDGAVVFTINTLAGLPSGATIANRAGIYFDYNAVVMTNTVENTIGCPGKLETNVPVNGGVDIYPNPVSEELTIQMVPGSYNSVTVANTLGQVIMQEQLTLAYTRLNVKTLPPGVYYLTLKGDNGNNKVERFVKM